MPRHKTEPAPGPMLRFVKQRHSSDCAVACLAMVTGLRYEDVLVAIDRPVIDSGMQLKEILATAERLKFPLRWKRKFDLDTDAGILRIRSPQLLDEHVVVLHEGYIFDTDGTVWDADDYLTALDAKPVSLLIRK